MDMNAAATHRSRFGVKSVPRSTLTDINNVRLYTNFKFLLGERYRYCLKYWNARYRKKNKQVQSVSSSLEAECPSSMVVLDNASGNPS